MEHGDGVVGDGLLPFQIRIRDHAAVRHAEQLRVARQLQQRHMGHGAAKADAGLLVDDGLQNGRRLHQALLQEACAAFAHERNGDGGRLFVRRSGDDGLRRDGVAEAAADGENLLRVADEQIVQNALLRGVQHGLEGVRVMRARNGNGLGPDCAGPFPKLGKAVDHGSSDLKAARHHARRGRRAGSARGISAGRSRR